jgi:hypothetical protein
MGAAVHYFSQIKFEVQLHQSEKIIAAHLDFDCMIFVGEPSASNLLRRKMGDVSYGLYAAPHSSKHVGCRKLLKKLIA